MINKLTTGIVHYIVGSGSVVGPHYSIFYRRRTCNVGFISLDSPPKHPLGRTSPVVMQWSLSMASGFH
jgi:hypothetical protein